MDGLYDVFCEVSVFLKHGLARAALEGCREAVRIDGPRGIAIRSSMFHIVPQVMASLLEMVVEVRKALVLGLARSAFECRWVHGIVSQRGPITRWSRDE